MSATNGELETAATPPDFTEQARQLVSFFFARAKGGPSPTVTKQLTDIAASALAEAATLSGDEREMRGREYQAERINAWLDNPNRQPANLAFTAGSERWIAYRVEKLLDEAATAALEQVAQWQPIKTAPKDGTDIFLWIPDGREIPIAGRWEPLVVSRKAKWVVDGGMLEDRFPLPTHWMPLPKPPIAAIGDDKE